MTEETKRKWTHGGARPGAGRKPDPQKKVRVEVRLTEEDREIFKRLGGSEWLHEALQKHAKELP